jgi:Fe2+ transport system protein FeoA
MPLALAREGATVKIVEVKVGRGLAHRMGELGLIPGSVIRVVKSSSPGPIIIEVDGYGENGRKLQATIAHPPPSWRIAIGFGMAIKILVQDLN